MGRVRRSHERAGRARAHNPKPQHGPPARDTRPAPHYAIARPSTGAAQHAGADLGARGPGGPSASTNRRSRPANHAAPTRQPTRAHHSTGHRPRSHMGMRGAVRSEGRTRAGQWGKRGAVARAHACWVADVGGGVAPRAAARLTASANRAGAEAHDGGQHRDGARVHASQPTNNVQTTALRL